jgi:hypothetical protein
MNAEAEKTAHTPGPWEVWATSHGWTVCNPDAGWSVCSLPQDHDQHEANARLIAAAPDMLKVCVRMLNHPLIRLTGDVEVPLRAAIAKASQP